MNLRILKIEQKFKRAKLRNYLTQGFTVEQTVAVESLDNVTKFQVNPIKIVKLITETATSLSQNMKMEKTS